MLPFNLHKQKKLAETQNLGYISILVPPSIITRLQSNDLLTTFMSNHSTRSLTRKVITFTKKNNSAFSPPATRNKPTPEHEVTSTIDSKKSFVFAMCPTSELELLYSESDIILAGDATHNPIRDSNNKLSAFVFLTRIYLDVI